MSEPGQRRKCFVSHGRFLDGPPGERRLSEVGKGDEARALPLSTRPSSGARDVSRLPGQPLTRP